MELSAVLISLFILMVTLIIYMAYSSRNSRVKAFKKMGIDGPTPWPLLGNLPEMLSDGFLRYNSRLYKKYENQKVYVAYEPKKSFIMIKDLDMIRDICIKNFNCFVNHRVFFDKEPYGNLLTQIKDEHWKRVRNAVSPAFSAGKLKRMFAHIEESSRILQSNLKKSCKEGKNVELKEVISCYSMDVIASAGFGVKVDSMNNKNNDFVTQAKTIINGFSGKGIALALVFPSLIPILEKIGIEALPIKPARYFSSFVHQAMATRQNEETKRQDFLQLMIDALERPADANSETGQNGQKKLTHSDIQGTALIFILAGYDTVATTMSFALFLLAHHPECIEKIQEELDRVLDGKFPSYEKVSELTYLDMCFNEALRMFPPAFVLDRHCNEECTIGGIHIPKDSYVMFPVYAIHHDPKLWPEPEKFDPERFSPANKEGRHPFAHMPFGHGPRSCIGMRLALLEIKVTMASILQELSPVPCEKSVYPIVLDKNIFKAANGLWVKFEPRQN